MAGLGGCGVAGILLLHHRQERFSSIPSRLRTFHRAAGQSVGYLILRESAVTEDVLEGDMAVSIGEGLQVGPDLLV